MSKTPPPPANAIPLVVDFDGTMHLADLTAVLLGWVAKTHPRRLPRLMRIYARHGRAALKLALDDMAVQAAWLPQLAWLQPVLQRMEQEQASGRTVLIVTGSTQTLVQRIVAGQGWNFEVIGTTHPSTNLTAHRKAAYLNRRFGQKGYDYMGNSKDDLAVWAHSRNALVVNARPRVLRAAQALGNVVWVFNP